MDQHAILEATNYIEQKLTLKPQIGLILGSGLGVLADEMDDKKIGRAHV